MPQPPATILNGGGWVRQGGDTWVFPHGSRFDISPTLILVKIMPLLNLVAAIVAGRVHLIKDAYLHDDKLDMYAACPDTPSVTIST